MGCLSDYRGLFDIDLSLATFTYRRLASTASGRITARSLYGLSEYVRTTMVSCHFSCHLNFHSILDPALKTQVDLAKVEVPTGQPRAVGSFFKLMYAYLFRGISFQEAAWTMWSKVAYVNEDTRKDYGERRFNLVALSRKGRALHITFTKRANSEITRIISVRRANKKERKKLQEKFQEATIE